MTRQTKNLGNSGEDLAAKYLTYHNFEIIGKNIRLKYGEIDIIARHGDDIILVEVKTKTTFDQGEPEEMVNWFKQKKLRLLARSLEQQYPNKNIRIDVVAVDLSTRKPKINHIVNAVERV